MLAESVPAKSTIANSITRRSNKPWRNNNAALPAGNDQKSDQVPSNPAGYGEPSTGSTPSPADPLQNWYTSGSICAGFSHFVSTLRPTAADRKVVKAAAAAFRRAAIHAARGKADWSVCGVYTVGSWDRGTALRSS